YLSRRDGARQARSLGGYSRDGLRAEVFLLQIPVGDLLLLPGAPLIPHGIPHSPSLLGERLSHFFGGFLVGMQQIGDARNRIVNNHERLSLSGSRQWPKARKRYLSANPALAIAVKITLCFSREVIAIGQRLGGFRYEIGRASCRKECRARATRVEE